MTKPIDIFQTENDGNVLWIAAARTLDDAKAHVQALARRSPCEYLLLDHKTGNKIVIRPDDSNGTTASRFLARPERKIKCNL